MISHLEYPNSKPSVQTMPISTTGILTTGKQVAEQLSTALVLQLEKDILHNKLIIGQTKGRLEGHNEETLQNRRGNLSKLKNSDEQEMQLQLSKAMSPNSRLFKSELTARDHTELDRMLQAQRRFEEDLVRKTKQYEENLKQFEQEERELVERERQEQKEERKKEVASHLEEIRQRQAKRKGEMEEQRKKMMEIKQQKTAMEKMSEEWERTEEQEHRRREEYIRKQREEKMVDFEVIREHERKYEELMRNQREEREKKMGELTRSSSKKYHHSRFFQQMSEEDQRIKREESARKSAAKQFVDKKNEYAELVRQKYKPVVIPRESKVEENEPVRSLSVLELYQRGNEYMRQAHEGLLGERNRNNNNNNSNNNVNVSGNGNNNNNLPKVVSEEPFRYKNYLKELKIVRKTGNGQPKYMTELDNLLQNEGLSQHEKYVQAKMITGKLDGGDGKPQQMINTINAKIHLLKSITEDR